ncbi:hypothetical protein [Polaromonas sp.]|uniref:hypothetical protein n=1 Tax=Polaromonas sp. TaxID=1869339 RepID=UPI001A2C1DBB|nr:hypothetical protein [Burkholderiales bacterium]
MQLGKRVNRCARSAQFHASASSLVKHPGSHDDDYTRVDLDVDHFACQPVLAVLPAQPATVERVPAVENLNLLPDMGRMTL